MASSTPSDIFRFVSTRAVANPENDAHSRRFVFLDVATDDARLDQLIKDAKKAQKDISPVLLIELPKLASTGEEQEGMMTRMVAEFDKSSSNRMNRNDLQKKFPLQALRGAYLWHRDNNQMRNITPAQFIQEIEKRLTMTVLNFLARNQYFADKIALWENLIAEYALPTPAGGAFMSELIEMIRWFWIFEKINTQNGLKDGQEIYEAMHATVVLPDDLIYFNSKINEKDEPKTPEKPGKFREGDEKRARGIEKSISELQYAARNQAADQKYKNEDRKNQENPNIVPPPSVLSPQNTRNLSPETRRMLDELGLITEKGVIVEQALERLRNEKNHVDENTNVTYDRNPFFDINGKHIPLDNPCTNYTPPDPCAPYNPNGYPLPGQVGLIRMPGIADLKVIKNTLLKYDIGELAHIENVLAGEVKVREFNTLQRMEETLVSEEETTTENEKESQTTDRFEMEKEMSSISKEDMKIDTGVKVTASLGPVSLDTHFDFQYNTSKEDSNKTATKTAQETMNRALSRVVERKRTQKTVTTILQTEDNNKHKLNNSTGQNIHGLYYWVDKYYLSKVVNYGKRLMFEFVIPEPAAFYLYSRQIKGEGERTPPTNPADKGISSFKDIYENNYASLAALYNAPDVVPPPPDYLIVTTSLKQDKAPSGKDTDEEDKKDSEFTLLDPNERLKVPAGYLAHHADISFVINQTTNQEVTGQNCDDGFLGSGYLVNCTDVKTTFQSFHILIGNQHLKPAGTDSPIRNILLNTEDSVIPLSVKGLSRHFIANFEVICYRTERRLQEWKNQTFNAIMAGYRNQLQQYEDWQRAKEVNQGIAIEGNPPEMNRRIEKEELKKHCIEMMTGQRFESFDAMRSAVPSFNYPEFSIPEAFLEGNYIQFFEQAFEWEQITYLFYPYFWGRKTTWVPTKKLTDPDTIFTSFLQAGAARVLIPARPGFEYDVVTFFASGGKKIWGGKQAPIPGSKEWLPIVDEIKEQEGQFKGGAQEGDPWIYKMPTTLVYLDTINANLIDNSATYPNDVAAAIAAKTSADFS